ncbi:MAG: AAA family ATPase [Clostridia bacterium]|nr:AAA family ATPase [Clostridia bacterium]
MYLKELHVENYRLLKDVSITLDKNLTLFVGKNNTGKTSLMEVIKFLISNATSLPFDDYPLDCRQELYTAIVNYWNDTSEDPLLAFQHAVPVTKITMTFDYSDGNLGNVAAFVIDLEEDVEEAIIKVSFDISLGIKETLAACKTQFDALINAEASDEQKKACLQTIVRNNFDGFFKMNIVAVNPANTEDIYEKKKADLQNLFALKVIHAERNMDESEAQNTNPLGQIMKALFGTEMTEMEAGVQGAMQELNTIVADANFNLQGQINDHMATIIENMMHFGYPAADDMTLRAHTNLALERRIIEETVLTYVSRDASETLPGSHNGLGYKNLIKISLELHDFARTIKRDLTKLPLLFIEEPEAHMHPQLQTTFVSFIEDFLTREVGTNIVQVLMTTHSAHVANTVKFEKIRYIQRHENCAVCKAMADFPTTGTAAEKAERLEFLQKYMKLSYCDLYFCDKAILVEGASERLLLPDMIRKCNEAGNFAGVSIPLTSQYYTIIEVGGAYAHNFYDFVDYLEIPTLILTDIDFVKGSHNNACPRNQATKSSNGAINTWCRRVLKLGNNKTVRIKRILELTEEQHTDGYRHLEFEKEESNFHPRSLEDAIMNCNRVLFGIADGANPDFEGGKEKKTDFAIKLLVENRYNGYIVPSYIRDGLIWLNGQTRTGGQ